MILNKKGIIKQFGKFAVVGFTGTLVHLIVLFVLTEYFGVYYIVSSIFAFIFAVTNNFILNKIWTFNKTSRGRNIERYISFFIIAIIAFFVNLSILYFLTEYFGVYYMFSQLIAIAFSLWINFIGNRLLTFRR